MAGYQHFFPTTCICSKDSHPVPSDNVHVPQTWPRDLWHTHSPPKINSRSLRDSGSNVLVVPCNPKPTLKSLSQGKVLCQASGTRQHSHVHMLQSAWDREHLPSGIAVQTAICTMEIVMFNSLILPVCLFVCCPTDKESRQT